VKKLLEDYFKESKLELGQHLNGDEGTQLISFLLAHFPKYACE
jgi:hypothetical protein